MSSGGLPKGRQHRSVGNGDPLGQHRNVNARPGFVSFQFLYQSASHRANVRCTLLSKLQSTSRDTVGKLVASAVKRDKSEHNLCSRPVRAHVLLTHPVTFQETRFVLMAEGCEGYPSSMRHQRSFLFCPRETHTWGAHLCRSWSGVSVILGFAWPVCPSRRSCSTDRHSLAL